VNDANAKYGSSLPVRVERDRDGGAWELLSPAVGLWAGHPFPGALIGPGGSLGRLTVLNRTYALSLPEGVAGRLDRLPRDRVVALEYGSTMGRLTPFGEGDQQGLQREPAEKGGAAELDLEAGFRAVVAPTDGVFYSRPHPDSPPFVEVGGQITNGQPVGLVEVMKTFNQIVYGGPGLPEKVTVTEIRCDDGDEIQTGQVLIVVRD